MDEQTNEGRPPTPPTTTSSAENTLPESTSSGIVEDQVAIRLAEIVGEENSQSSQDIAEPKSQESKNSGKLDDFDDISEGSLGLDETSQASNAEKPTGNVENADSLDKNDDATVESEDGGIPPTAISSSSRDIESQHDEISQDDEISQEEPVASTNPDEDVSQPEAEDDAAEGDDAVEPTNADDDDSEEFQDATDLADKADESQDQENEEEETVHQPSGGSSLDRSLAALEECDDKVDSGNPSQTGQDDEDSIQENEEDDEAGEDLQQISGASSLDRSSAAFEVVDAKVDDDKPDLEESDILSDDRTQVVEEKESEPKDEEEGNNSINKSAEAIDPMDVDGEPEAESAAISSVEDVEMHSVESSELKDEKDGASEMEVSVDESKDKEGLLGDDVVDKLAIDVDDEANITTVPKVSPKKDANTSENPIDLEEDKEEDIVQSTSEPVDDKDDEEPPIDDITNEAAESQAIAEDVEDLNDQPAELIESTPDVSLTLDEENIDAPAETAEHGPEDADICLIPDSEQEVTPAEREQAILARENAEKEDQEKEKEKEPEPTLETPTAAASEEHAAEEHHAAELDQHKIIICSTVLTEETCVKCKIYTSCGFRYKHAESGSYHYLCGLTCGTQYMEDTPGKFFIRRKKFLVEEANDETNHSCIHCKEEKVCKYFFKQDDDSFYICNDDCFNLLSAEEPDKFKLKRHSIRVRNIGATISTATKESAEPESRIVARNAAEAETAKLDRARSFVRRCAECYLDVDGSARTLQWETLDFCNEICLAKHQNTIGASCQTCSGKVSQQSMGKYCVRFGFDIRQFCCASCLNKFKKGLKTCSCCQKDISSTGEGFLAPVGDNEQFKDFCSQTCMRHYDFMCNPKKRMRCDTCAVCNNQKMVRVEMLLDEKEHQFCSNPCFSAFKFVSNICTDQCSMCAKHFERKSAECYTIFGEKRPKVFCCRICVNAYINVNRKIVSCNWCKVKKYNFDMISKTVKNREILICSLNCLKQQDLSTNGLAQKSTNCDSCNATVTLQYHLPMSDATVRKFCTYQCVMQFRSKFGNEVKYPTDTGLDLPKTQPFPIGMAKRVKQTGAAAATTQTSVVTKQTPAPAPAVPVIANVASLALAPQPETTMIGNVTVRRTPGRRGRKPKVVEEMLPTIPLPTRPIRSKAASYHDVAPPRSPTPPPPVKLPFKPPVKKRNVGVNTLVDKTLEPKTKIITIPPLPPLVRNMQTMCAPQMVSCGTDCAPEMCDAEVQTEKDYSSTILIPVPVPIYIPQPMYMYSAPFPVPVPIPLPIPVPIFIPTTRNSAQGILKEIKKIQDKMPADPFEAELLMMAEMVADEKRDSDSDSDEETKPEYKPEPYAHNAIEPTNAFGEDVLQMALKMASGDYEESNDLETSMTANTITNPPPGLEHQGDMQMIMMDTQNRGGRGRKRGAINTSPVTPRNNRSPVKRARRDATPNNQQVVESSPQAVQPTEKPDVNMCLKYTFGVNAWKQWVMTKNSDIEKSSIRRRPFKTELLQMTADELNYSLCLFVKEVRKPNGTEYAPDTIYYLVLGIQQYLYENGRIDNIFTDPYYERFTDCLDEVAKKFSILYNDSQYIVTRVEEAHLWECKQLGAHSPHVLLSTLMFFNTKHFNLTTVEEHMQLSFSHIMKHWKRTPQNVKTPTSRNVLLRFYPPQAGLDANPRKKKVYEQQENEENPLRCPVRLYEFYLSKCPESVKTRNDVFYLQPERSCVPDSPVWYSTQPLSRDALQKMLHRVKMVKEINIALLTS